MCLQLDLNQKCTSEVQPRSNLTKCQEQGLNGPRSGARFKPEVHPRSKLTKCPDQEQLKQLLGPFGRWSQTKIASAREH